MNIFIYGFVFTFIITFIIAIYFNWKNQLTECFDSFPYNICNKKKTITVNNYTFSISPIRNNPIMLELYPFLKPNECNHLINISKEKFKRSPVVSKGGIDDIRTSYSCFLTKSGDSIISDIENRICKFCNIDNCMLEQFQVVRYLPNQQFNYHYDWFDPTIEEGRNEMKHGGQRRYTIFIYLNDLSSKEYRLNKELGTNNGKTCFKKHNICINPKQGLGIFWKNIVDGKLNYDSLHAGIAPKYSIKYGLNVWVRERSL